MRKRYLLLLVLLAAASFPSVALAQPVGPEFQVNTYTTSYQGSPSVASDASGNFVVVWDSRDQDGYGRGVFGQRYDNNGNPLGGEFIVNTNTFRDQFRPSVASGSLGNFVVVWGDMPQPGNERVKGQRYDSSGNRAGPEFTIGGYSVVNPSVASDAAGAFIVVWADYSYPTDYDVYGRRYDSNGNPLGGSFQVSTYTIGNQDEPSVASDTNGNFVVVWTSHFGFQQDGSQAGVFGQRYDNSGNRLGGEFQVNTYTTDNQESPSVASDASGNFVVVWQSQSQDGDSLGIFGQRYDANGNRMGGEFQVNSTTTSDQDVPSVASDVNGNFVVVWASDQDGGGGSEGGVGVVGQRFDSDGNPVGGEFQVNTHTPNFQSDPSVASDASGNFVVVWTSEYPRWELHLTGVFGQRFSAACEASLQVQGDVHTPGSKVAIQVHIAHRRPEDGHVPWEMRLIDANGRVILRHTTAPHTFEPGDVVDREVEFRLPDNLASGTYTLELAISGMAGTKGATTTFRVIRAE